MNIGADGTLYFNRIAGYLGYANPISGSGTLQISQGVHSLHLGTGYNTALAGFAGTVKLLSGGVYLHSSNAVGSGGLNLSSGAICDLDSSEQHQLQQSDHLKRHRRRGGRFYRPAIYGDGSGAAYTLSGQITLAASSDVGNSENNSPLLLGGKITGPGGLVIGKPGTVQVTQYGAVTLAGASSNDYSGATTINRGTLYLQKTAGAIAIPGNVSISASGSGTQGNTYLILKGSDQIASTATLSFAPVLAMNSYFELLGNQQTLAGISDGLGHGIIENAEQETGINTGGTLTINNTANYSYNGCHPQRRLRRQRREHRSVGVGQERAGHVDAYRRQLQQLHRWLDGQRRHARLQRRDGAAGHADGLSERSHRSDLAGGDRALSVHDQRRGAEHRLALRLDRSAADQRRHADRHGHVAEQRRYDVRGGRIDANLSGGSIGLSKSSSTTAVL